MDNIRFLSIDYFFYQIYLFFAWVGNLLFGTSSNTLDSDGDGIIDDIDKYPFDPNNTESSFWDRLFGSSNTVANSTFFGSALHFFVYFFGLVALIFAGMIFFSYMRWQEELNISKKNFKDSYKGLQEIELPKYKHARWATVLAHTQSLNQSEWRLAILEADTMLAELLDRRGYKGLSIGEQLKSIDAEKFTSIQDAWEAHKVRNQIAHEGSAFTLTERETRRIIGLYERVFREFDFI